MPRYDLPLDELEQYRPDVREPDDFDDFWSRTLDEARTTPSAPLSSERSDCGISAVDIYDVRFPGFGGQPIAAWLILPRERSTIRGGIVEFVGYGGGRGLPHERLTWASAGFGYLIMDTRGQGSRWSVGVTPDSATSIPPSAPGMLTRGIDNAGNHYFRRLFTDAARAVDAFRSLEIVDPSRVSVAGGSQGGGISLAAAGILRDVATVICDVPFLCHFERAVGLTDAYPYQEVVDYLRVHRDAVEQVFTTFSYMDGVNFAKRSMAPALFSAALEDEVCPPSTVFAAANLYSGPAQVDVYPYNGHEGGGGDRWPRQLSWLESLGI